MAAACRINVRFYAITATPDEIIGTVHAQAVSALNSPDVKTKLAAQGAEVETSSPGQFLVMLRADFDRWRTVAKAAGVKAE